MPLAKLTAELIGEKVQVSEAYDNTGTAARLRLSDGRLVLVVEHWCGGAVEGSCFRDFVSFVPCEHEAKLAEAFALTTAKARANAIAKFERDGIRMDRLNLSLRRPIFQGLYGEPLQVYDRPNLGGNSNGNRTRTRA